MLWLDPLSDMLRDVISAFITVTAANDTETYRLFEYVQPNYLPFETLPFMVKTAVNAARLLVRSGRRRYKEMRTSALLAALPVEEGIGCGEAYLSSVSPVFAALCQARQTSITVLKGKFLPEHLPLLFYMDDTDPVVVDADYFDENGGRGTASFHRASYKIDTTYTTPVRWSQQPENRGIELYLAVNNNALRLCPECHEFFLWSSLTDRAQHRHGQKFQPLPVSPYDAITIQRIEWNVREALLKYEPNYAGMVDRSVVNTYRIRTEHNQLRAIAEQKASPFTAVAFRAASAEWVSRYQGSDADRSKIDRIVAEDLRKRLEEILPSSG